MDSEFGPSSPQCLIFNLIAVNLMYQEFGPSSPQRGSKSNEPIRQALDYVTMVKKTFKETPDLYDKFMAIMTDYKNKKICIQELKDKVVNIFNGHDDLLVGFNTFFPEGHKIRIPGQNISIPVHELVTEPVNPPVEMEEAWSSANMVKGIIKDYEEDMAAKLIHIPKEEMPI